MAGTVVETHFKRGAIGVVTLTCTADAADGSYPTTEIGTKISGRLVALETNPGAVQPTDNYDIVINDAESNDNLQGVGANRDTLNTEKVPIVYSGTALHPVVAYSDVQTLVITNNVVNSAVVVIKLYYEGEGNQ